MNVQSQWILETGNVAEKGMDWWYYMTKMPSFQSFVEREDIHVRCMNVESMKLPPNDTCEEQMELGSDVKESW
jgi:hypothetical protein